MGAGTVGRYWTKSTPVDAVQYTGINLGEIEVVIKELTGRDVTLGGMLDVGAWVVISGTSYQVLPNSHFHRIYEAENDAPKTHLSVQVVPIPIAKTCFTCVHHLDTRCMLFDEQIDSEIYAAADCSGYEYDGDKDDV
jgi:hypothetical protein